MQRIKLKEGLMRIFQLLTLLAGSGLVSCAYLQKITGGKEETQISGPGSEDIISQDIDSDNKGSDSGAIEGLRTVYFALDSSVLTEESKEILQANANWLNSNSQVARLELEGHCDPLGSEAYNIGLGRRRAESVKNHLTGVLGVNEERISVISYGEEKPLSEVDNSLNRRVNFVPIY